MQAWVVLPAYNEAENLPALLEGFRSVAEDTYNLSLHVIVVDDGSTDNTVGVARSYADRLPLEVLENVTNKGLAATFMRGIVAAAQRAQNNDIIICMDADNTHLPGLMLRMLNSVREGRDVVIASRYQPGAFIKGVPFSRRFLSWCMSLLFRVIYPIPAVRDYSCGYRAYRASFVKEALKCQGDRLFSSEGFACMVAIVLRLHKQGAIFGEVPMILRYDQKSGQSKMKVGRTIIRTLRVLLRERFTRD